MMSFLLRTDSVESFENEHSVDKSKWHVDGDRGWELWRCLSKGNQREQLGKEYQDGTKYVVVHLSFKRQRRKKESEQIAACPHGRHSKLAQNSCAVKLGIICLLDDTPKKQNLVFRRNIQMCRCQICPYFLRIFASLITVILLLAIKQVEVPWKVSFFVKTLSD